MVTRQDFLDIRNAWTRNETVYGKITGNNKHGDYLVSLKNGVFATLPRVHFCGDPDILPENDIPMKILDMTDSYGNWGERKTFIKVSCFLEQTKEITQGSVIDTIVKSVDDDKVTLDYNSARATLMLYDIAGRNDIDSVRRKFRIGSRVVVMVTNYNRERAQIKVSEKKYRWALHNELDATNVGDIKDAVVRSIEPNYVRVELGMLRGTLFAKNLINKNEFPSIGDSLKVMVLEKPDDPNMPLSVGTRQIREAEIKAEKERIGRIAESLRPGYVINATVKELSKDGVSIALDEDIPGFIPKDEMQWGFSDLRQLAFKGEKRNVCYLREEDGVLICSARYLETDKYDDALYSMDLNSILKNLGISQNSFTGKIVLGGKGTMFFEDIYADSEEDDGALLVDPVTGSPIKILLSGKVHNIFIPGLFYHFELSLTKDERRKDDRTPYRFWLTDGQALAASKEPRENPYKYVVDRSFYKHNSPSSNTTQANLLEEVGQGLYDSKDRMFFELLQNADDAAASGGVQVALESVDGFLILTHNGLPFNRKDYVSITSAARSNKRGTKSKTGYKGIGFKSVFTNSSKVHIKTGGFFFSFDKTAPIFSDFEAFYFKVNDKRTPEEQKAFIKDNREEYDEFRGVDSIPWQMLPFWSDSIPEGLENTSFSRQHNVSIALAMNDSVRSEYVNSILGVLNDPKFMLFLRNTSRISYSDAGKEFTLAKKKYNGRVTLQSTQEGNESIDEYLVDEGTFVEISDKAFKDVDVDIHISKSVNPKTGKKETTFVNGAGMKIAAIPNRIAESAYTQIAYAIALDKNGNYDPLKRSNSMYAYLPMVEKRFPFPIYINADFILKSNRQGIMNDNVWNHFLMYHIGRNYAKWIQKAASIENRLYLNLLPGELFDENDNDMVHLASYFNKGYVEAIESEAFIINDKGELTSQNGIVTDATGLSSIIGAELFCELTGNTGKRMPHPAIDSSILNKPLFKNVLHVTDVKSFLMKKENMKYIRHWFSCASEQDRVKSLKWIVKQNDGELAAAMPVFMVAGRYRSIRETFTAESANFMYLDTHFLEIRAVLEKLGFYCVDGDISKHPFYAAYLKDSYLNPQGSLLKGNAKSIVTRAIAKSEEKHSILTSFEKNLLYTTVMQKVTTDIRQAFDNWALFHNCDGDAVKVSALMEKGTDAAENLLFSAYIVDAEDLNGMSVDVRNKMMSRDRIYPVNILRKWSSVTEKWISLGANNEWTDAEYAMLYQIVKDHYDAYKSNHPFEQVPTISSFEDAAYLLSGKKFYERDSVFFSPSLSEDRFRDACSKALDVKLPEKDTLEYLSKAPFITAPKNWTTQALSANAVLTCDELSSIISFCKEKSEAFFDKYVITEKDEKFSLRAKTAADFLFYTDDLALKTFVDTNVAGAISLPDSFQAFSKMSGIHTDDALLTNVFEKVNCNDVLSTILPIVQKQSRKSRIQFIQKLGKIELGSSILSSSPEYLSLIRLCADIYTDTSVQEDEKVLLPSRTDISITSLDASGNTSSKTLSNIHLQGKVKIGAYTFNMDDLNPSELQGVQVSTKELLESLRTESVSENYLSELFDLNSEISSERVLATLNNGSALQNGEQLAFLIRYKDANPSVPANFSLKAKDGTSLSTSRYSMCLWYIDTYSFIEDRYTLDEKYSKIYDLVCKDRKEPLPWNIVLLKSPDSFSHLKNNLTKQEKHDLLDYLYGRWSENKLYWNDNMSVPNVAATLGIDNRLIVLSDGFSLEDEKLSEEITSWLTAEDGNTDDRKDFLVSVFGIDDEASDLVGLRRYASTGEMSERTYSSDGLCQSRLCKWISVKKISLSEPQYDFISGYLDEDKYSDTVDINKVELSIQGDKPDLVVNKQYNIYRYDGIIPRIATLSGSNYVFYRYEDGDYCMNGYKIIVSTNAWRNLESILLTIAGSNQNSFSSNDFLAYMRDRGQNISDAESKVADLEDEMQAIRNENAKLRAMMDGEDANLDFLDERLTGLDNERKWEALKEARRAVREHLRIHEGFFVPDEEEDPKDWTKIEGVRKGGEEYTVIVRSYRDSESRSFELNSSDWINLMEGTSMLWIYTKKGPECFPFRDLIRNKSLITLRFSTSNLDYPKRMTALAESLRYFKRLSFDFGPGLANGHKTAQRFIRPEQKLNEILKEDDINDMF